MNINWINLINEKEEEIIEVAKKAYKEALENTNQRCIVELDSDGEVSCWYDTAGGNSFHVSNREDYEVRELMEFCFQYFKILEETEGFETEEEAIEWYVDEYALDEINQKIECKKQEIEEYEN